MKQNKMFWILVALAMASCDYNAQFEGLEDAKVTTDVRTLEYTMTDADYATLAGLSAAKTLAGDSLKDALAALKTNKAFSSKIVPSIFAPLFIANYLPTVDDMSAVKLTYNYQGELPDYVTHILAGKCYSLKTADYESVWGEGSGVNFFTPSMPAASKIPAILGTVYANAEANDVVMVSYNDAEKEPSGTVVAVNENFEQFAAIENPDYHALVEGWENVTTKGTYYWSGRTFSNNGYIQQSAYKHAAGELESYMITPRFVARNGMKLTFDIAHRYFASDGGRIAVLVSENFVAGTDSLSNVQAVQAATWTDITAGFTLIQFPESGASLDLAPAGEYDLSAYAGKKIHIAFRYQGDKDTKTTTIQIDNVVIKLEGEAEAEPVVTTAKNDVYKYNGTSWIRYTENNTFALSKSDFATMGSSYDNFSASMSADAYLPIYLAVKYPYAQENAKCCVTYKYYASSVTTLKADEYFYTGGVWVKNNAVEIKKDQFVKTNKEWKYNPSVVLNLLPVKNEAVAMSYYQAATDWVWENIDVAELGCTAKGQGYVTSYGNNEYYTGCSAYYNNVDMRVAKAREQYAAGYTDMTDDEVLALMEKRLIEVMGKVLGIMHPDAAPIEGIDITYTVNVGIYYGTQISACTHTIVYKVIGVGEFEYVPKSFQPIQ